MRAAAVLCENARLFPQPRKAADYTQYRQSRLRRFVCQTGRLFLFSDGLRQAEGRLKPIPTGHQPP
ncbi:hypothetical protein HMPREF9120_01898 [Neisseria sp. oral taxon 020 str. F0370]|nr:hypothetical protein HMPREF9120_01898 [Neisseria sp. oral taxon 020 str. F0370]